MEKVLIITKSDDNESIKYISDAIRDLGGEPIRFDSDRYPSEISLNSKCINGEWHYNIKDGNKTIELDDLASIWYRRLNIAARLNNIIDSKYMLAAKEESRRTFKGFMATTDAFVMDRLWKIRYADMKQMQLKVAAKLGLKIPGTLFTNSPKDTTAFYNETHKNMITKMQTSFAIYEEGVENVVFTNKIKDEDLQELDSIQFCPMTFQESIEKKCELRITIVGKEVFAAAIDSQKLEAAKNDWRKEGLTFIRAWEKYDLPKDIEEKLLKLMEYYQLNYGAIDVIVTKDDEYIFLEINPGGEFFWLELYPGFPIAQEMAKVLLNKTYRREKLFAQEDLINF